MNLIENIRQGESKTLELKAQLPQHEQIAKTAVAFANTSGGKLVIGVSDDRQVVGLPEEDVLALQSQIGSIIFDRCHPAILPEMYTANLEGKTVLVVEVFRGNLLPYYLKEGGKNQGTYLRVGSSNRKADFEHILELERQRRNQSFDEEVYRDTTLSALDLRPLLTRFAAIGKPLDAEKLKNLKLAQQEQGTDYPTQGLMILLGLLPHVATKCARFKGTDMNVVSPGGFPNTLTAEALLEGRSEIRNRVIARVFKELGYIEQWGSGIQRIKSACIAQGLAEPRIREKGDFVDVEFYRPTAGVGKTAETGGSTPENARKIAGAPDYARLRPITPDPDKLPVEEARILLYLLDHGQISRKDAMSLLGLGETKVKALFVALAGREIIARRGQGRGTCYVLAQKS